jgi:hypothetical protein
MINKNHYFYLIIQKTKMITTDILKNKVNKNENEDDYESIYPNTTHLFTILNNGPNNLYYVNSLFKENIEVNSFHKSIFNKKFLAKMINIYVQYLEFEMYVDLHKNDTYSIDIYVNHPNKNKEFIIKWYDMEITTIYSLEKDKFKFMLLFSIDGYFYINHLETGDFIFKMKIPDLSKNMLLSAFYNHDIVLNEKICLIILESGNSIHQISI